MKIRKIKRWKKEVKNKRIEKQRVENGKYIIASQYWFKQDDVLLDFPSSCFQ